MPYVLCLFSIWVDLLKENVETSPHPKKMICFLLEGFMILNVEFAQFAAEIMVEKFDPRNRHEIDVHDEFIRQQRLLRVVYNMGFL